MFLTPRSDEQQKVDAIFEHLYNLYKRKCNIVKKLYKDVRIVHEYQNDYFNWYRNKAHKIKLNIVCNELKIAFKDLK